MIYNNFQDIKLSSFGMGTMRLPVIDGDDSRIDQAATEEMIKYAMDHGVNYYDTAWGYHGENSEIAVGKALKAYPRDRFYLATKFPGYDLKNMPKVAEIFEKQLEKTQVEYFDFYLIHNVCEMNIDEYLNEEHGILDYVLEQKKNGRIKHLGFSAHGSVQVIERFLEKYGPYMEFGQLQLNYLDWTFQNDERKVKLLTDRNIPVWVMEPVRGGKLATLPEEYAAQLRDLRPDEAPIAWAYRFLQSLPQVTVTLSGSSSLEQLKENISYYEESKSLTGKEMEELLAIAEKMLTVNTVPCTACKYCISHCPKELDIPHLLSLYNEHSFTEGGFLAPMALMAIDKEKQPNACIGCKSCEAVCPQQIKISDTLKDFTSKLGA